MSILARELYHRPALEVARDLLGCRLVRVQSGHRMSGLILETEAYQGEEDLGCHASAGLTPRTSTMYGPPGHAYVYFTYGMHWLLNAVADGEGTPAAVLIRAIQPDEGQLLMAENRPKNANRADWTDGPAKLTQALGIQSTFNGIDLCSQQDSLWIENGRTIQEKYIKRTPRIGLTSVPEPWRSIPWRLIADQEALNG